MKDLTKKQYTDICLQLIEIRDQIDRIWATCDKAILDDIISIFRWYRQFSK